MLLRVCVCGCCCFPAVERIEQGFSGVENGGRAGEGLANREEVGEGKQLVVVVVPEGAKLYSVDSVRAWPLKSDK